jgi:membrane glycosyltransferase
MEQVKPDPVRGSPLLRGGANEYSLLPAEAPLHMPVQPLALTDAQANAQANAQADTGANARGRTRDQMTWPRAALLGLSLGAIAVYALTLYQVLSVVQLTVLQGIFLVLCTLCFAWIALGTCSAILGFFGILLSAKPEPAEACAQGRDTDLTALLFPVHQEDAARIAATIEAIAKELTALGCEQKFDVFMLSDSRLGDCKARELRAARFLRRRLQGRMRIYYRARSDNVGKKAGNIADWVRRFGGAYQSFVILDADSIMSGALLVRLQRELASRPNCGLLQTVPRLVDASTLFARLQQFAVAFYGPVVAAGFAAWHHNSGNYWGHNAIVRTQAFAHAAGLPELPGRPPFGGHVQSHDFVEAAFLRRAGWDVQLLPDLRGSYEGCPPTLIDVAVRDRRWAQGNLQHLRIVATSGLPFVSRLHLIMGTYAYLASTLWALSLIVGIILSVQSTYTLPVYFPQTKTLFPIWPVIDPTKALYLFLGTMLVLLLPKILGIYLALARRDAASSRPPLRTFLAGASLEMLFSILVAPILMLTQTRAVLEIIRGKDSGWSVQRRDGERPDLREILRFHYGHTFCGAALAIVCALASGYVLAWMAPIVLGLLLSASISRITAKVAPHWAATALATPEDLAPPEIVRAAHAAYPEWAAMLARRPAAA